MASLLLLLIPASSFAAKPPWAGGPDKSSGSDSEEVVEEEPVPATAEEPAQEGASPFFGVNAQFMSLGGALSHPDPKAHLAAIADTDLGMVRYGPSWHAAEPQPPVDGDHTYDWAEWDYVVRMTASEGLEIYALLAYGTRWSNGDWSSPAGWKNPPGADYYADFAAYAAAVADRYGRGGTFWEENPELPYRPIRNYQVWNEGNWRGPEHFEPEAYADLFLETEAGIREVDPNARVVFNALAAATGVTGAIDGDDYLRRAFDHRPELAERVRVVGVHLYGHWPWIAQSQLARWRRWVDTHAGEAIRLDITEDGVAIADQYDWWRADYLRTMAETVPFSGCDVGVYLPHTWWTPEQDATDVEHWYGIARSDGTPKGSAKAFTDAARSSQALLDQGSTPSDPTVICP